MRLKNALQQQHSAYQINPELRQHIVKKQPEEPRLRIAAQENLLNPGKQQFADATLLARIYLNVATFPIEIFAYLSKLSLTKVCFHIEGLHFGYSWQRTLDGSVRSLSITMSIIRRF